MVLLWAHPSYALQPLEAFVKSAKLHHPDALDAQANREQRDSQVTGALGRVLPGIVAKGTYTRNQYEVKFSLPTSNNAPSAPLTIQPFNQFDGNITLNVPLIDIANFTRLAAARDNAAASASQLAAVELRVQAQVVQLYYQLVANAALVEAARHALDVARSSLQLVRDRLNAGKAAVLDAARAEAEVERQVQQLTAAELQVDLISASLASASGLTPEMPVGAKLEDDLHSEDALSAFERDDEQLPAVRAAVQARRALESQATAQKLTLIPALNGALTERFTNAVGFSGGRTRFYLATVSLTWNFDLATVGNINGADASVASGVAGELRARLAARDDIKNTWKIVASNISRSRSARAQAQVTTQAATLAQDRYSAGVATQLDLLQAQRDSFAADASRIQADADLANARAQLRLVSGIRFEDYVQEKKP